MIFQGPDPSSGHVTVKKMGRNKKKGKSQAPEHKVKSVNKRGNPIAKHQHKKQTERAAGTGAKQVVVTKSIHLATTGRGGKAGGSKVKSHHHSQQQDNKSLKLKQTSGPTQQKPNIQTHTPTQSKSQSNTELTNTNESQQQAQHVQQPASTTTTAPIANKTAPKLPQMSALQEQMKTKLEGAQFRWINEQLYTTTGSEALQLLQKNPQYFDVYHKGYRSQVAKWPENPVDKIISWIKTLPKTHIIADLGCGEAKLARSVLQKVFSFDLVAANETVTACDIAHLPLESQTVDVVVFCLSLMGTNVADFLKEANRILKNGGMLKIAEVKSRIPDTKRFLDFATSLGFQLRDSNDANKMFVLFTLTKINNKLPRTLPKFEFKPCLYKKR